MLCPQPRSLYALCTLALLVRAQVPVKAVIVRRLGWKRVWRERKDIRRNLRKVWRKLILQSSENPGPSSQTLAGLAVELGVSGTTLGAYCRSHGISYRTAVDFDHPDTRRILQQSQPSCVAFTGGGLIADETLRLAGAGIINCHMGILPEYKGMDVVEWPLLEGKPRLVGAHTHFMAHGVDTGPVLLSEHVDPADFHTVSDLRNEIERRMPVLMSSTIISLRDGVVAPRSQPPAGRQYFRMHASLRNLLPSRLDHIRRMASSLRG
jgi:folate-dependent phosphoribosylglycinamide formyltransferase PurN